MKLSKKPVVNGILNALFTAALFTLVIYIMSLIKKVPFAQQYSTMSIIICVVGSIGAGISGYTSALKENDDAKKKNDK